MGTTPSPDSTSGQARLIIVSAPSGAGKTSLARGLIRSSDHFSLSVSHTTRSPRPGEKDGRDYFYVSRKSFLAMVEQNAFLEYAEVFGNFYGTSRKAVEENLKRGKSVVLDIDWQGARKVRENSPDVLSIFILPPSIDSLRQRLLQRGQDAESVIEHRMQKAMSEMQHYGEYDYVIINDNFESALKQLTALCNGSGDALTPSQIDTEKLVFIEKNVTLAN